MKRSTARLLAAALAAALATGCGPAQEAPTAKAADSEPAATNRIGIPPLVRKNLGITFAKVEARHVSKTVRVPGAFELRPRSRSEYRMVLPGRVELLVAQYDSVEEGQTLYRFQSPEWPNLLHEIVSTEQAIDAAQAEQAVATAKVAEARRTLELLRERIGSLARADFKAADLDAEAAKLEASLPTLEAEARLAATRLENARTSRELALHKAAAATGIPEEELDRKDVVDGREVHACRNVDWIEVRAKAAGVVEALNVTDGAFVESFVTVMSTVDPRKLRFRALALQADLPRLLDAEEAYIVPPESPGLAIDDTARASITLGLEAHPRERSLTLLAVPERLADWMRPGVSAFLEIVTDTTDGPALAVPRSAIVKDGTTHVFFLRDAKDPNQAIRMEADMGVSDGRWVVLESGVMRGSEVVLEGAYELKLATQLGAGAQKGGHFHADGSFHDGED